MNAALIGFSRADTAARLSEIERFAEIGDFINQPVKTYSSGMYVRLAFAIAVNTEPDILVVDEALSVGDTIFQHRCVRRIREMQERGTTILFVSHDPTLVRALCSRAILLNAGRLIADGTPMDVLNRYQRVIMAREEAYAGGNSTAGTAAAVAHLNETPSRADETATQEDASATQKINEPATEVDESASQVNEVVESGARPGEIEGVARQPLQYSYRHGNGQAEVIGAELLDAAGRRAELIESGAAVTIRMRFRFRADVPQAVCGFMIRTRHGVNVYGTNTEQRGQPLGAARRGEIIEAAFDFNCWLGQEHYFVSVAVHSPEGQAFDWLDGVIFFRVACAVEMEGIANLDARVTTSRRIGERNEPAGTDEARAVQA